MSETAANEVNSLLRDVRRRLAMDVALVSHFEGGHRMIDVVDAEEPVPVAAVDGAPVEDTYCQRIVDGRLPEAIPDTATSPEARSLAATTALGIGAHLGVPIVLEDGTVYGALCTYSHDRRPDLDDRSATVLGVVADTIARALAVADEAHQAREAVLTRIDTVVGEDLVELAYQPIVDIVTRTTVAIEALARFPPFLGGGTTSDWFAGAVAVGADQALELACLAQAGAQLGRHDIDVHVNLSPAVLLRPETAALLLSLPLRRIVLEVTEHQAVEDYPALLEALAPLRARGARLAIDDAGAGFASLRHALLLKPDLLKLDISLVREIDSDPARRSLCQALTGFAHATGAVIVAEGVETEHEAEVLHALAVDLAQGFLFSRPAPLGGPSSPVPLPGGPAAAPVPEDEPDETSAVLAALREVGASPATIAAALNGKGLLTPSGRRWHPASVTRLLL